MDDGFAQDVVMKRNPEYPEILRPMDHLEMACQFLEAYKFGCNTRPPNWPRYFLACHSVELVLKAFLLQRGVPEKTTWSYGHDLVKILNQAVAVGLKVDEYIKSDIADLNAVHMDLWHRYPRTFAKPVILIHQFDHSIESLFTIVKAGWNAE